jgi:hypothetical protein
MGGNAFRKKWSLSENSDQSDHSFFPSIGQSFSENELDRDIARHDQNQANVGTIIASQRNSQACRWLQIFRKTLVFENSHAITCIQIEKPDLALAGRQSTSLENSRATYGI